MQPAGEKIARLALPSAYQINKQLPVLYFTKNRRGRCSAAYHGNMMVKSRMSAEVWLLSCDCSLALSSNPVHWHAGTGCPSCHWLEEEVGAIPSVLPHRVVGLHSYRLRLKKNSRETVATKPKCKTERGKREKETYPLSSLWILQKRVTAPTQDVPGETRQKPMSTHFCKPPGLAGSTFCRARQWFLVRGVNSPSPVAGVISSKERHRSLRKTSTWETAERACALPQPDVQQVTTSSVSPCLSKTIPSTFCKVL